MDDKSNTVGIQENSYGSSDVNTRKKSNYQS